MKVNIVVFHKLLFKKIWDHYFGDKTDLNGNMLVKVYKEKTINNICIFSNFIIYA